MLSKENKRNIDPISLPTNYKELFKFTYRVNAALICKLSLVIFCFAIPLLVAFIFQGGIENSIISADKEIEQAILRTRIMMFRGIYGFVYLLGFIIFSIGLSGVYSIMKKQLWNDGMIFSRDFKEGIKKNCVSFMLVTFVIGLILSFSNFALNLLSTDNLIQYYAPIFTIFCVLSLILTSCYFIALHMVSIYKVKFFQCIKNTLLIFFNRLPFNILALLASIAPLVVFMLIPNSIVMMIGILIYMLIGFGHSLLTIELFNLASFDKLVNKNQFPEIYRKGIFETNNEDDEIIDEGFNK